MVPSQNGDSIESDFNVYQADDIKSHDLLKKQKKTSMQKLGTIALMQNQTLLLPKKYNVMILSIT